MMLTALKPAKFPWFDYSRYSFSLGREERRWDLPLRPYRLGIRCRGEAHRGARHMSDQVRTAWAKIGAILESGGLGYADVVRVVEYVKPEGIERYAEADAVRREVFKGHQPVVNTVPVKALLRPEAFIEIEVTASAAPGAKLSSGVVFLPTVQPLDDQGNIVGAGDVVAQTRAIFERAGRMLGALGAGLRPRGEDARLHHPGGARRLQGHRARAHASISARSIPAPPAS